ncbi:hypothetical protein ACNH6B_01725 [Shewanella basaltis]|uniref:hypothetical protein n=1 Tax=Shewanella basaltis TaxID=472183 RepID=UPI003AAC410A
MHELIYDIWQQNNLTIFMVTHDIKEGFELGSRLWVFDKLRHDPQAPNAYGAQVTFDLPLTTQKHKKIAQKTLEESSQNV